MSSYATQPTSGYSGIQPKFEKLSNKEAVVNEIPEEEASFYTCKERDEDANQGYHSAEEWDEEREGCAEELSRTKSRFAQAPPRRKRLNLIAPKSWRAQLKTAICAPFAGLRNMYRSPAGSAPPSTPLASIPLEEPRKVLKRVMWRDATGDASLEDVKLIENCLALVPGCLCT